MKSSKLILKRHHAVADMLRAYKVMLDGNEAGALMPKQELELNVPPGRHQVQFKVDWCTSPVLDVELEPGHASVITCRGKNTVPGMFAAILLVKLLYSNDVVPGPLAVTAIGLLAVGIGVMFTAKRGDYIIAEHVS